MSCEIQSLLHVAWNVKKKLKLHGPTEQPDWLGVNYFGVAYSVG